MLIGRRIRELRKHLRLSGTEFGKRISLTHSAISQIETGKNVPLSKTIEAILEVYNVNKDWLETGKGDMFRPVGSTDSTASASPSREAFIIAESLDKFGIDKRPVKEVEEIRDLLSALLEIVSFDDKVIKSAAKSSLIALRESVRDRIEKQKMQKDIEEQRKVLNFQSHHTKRKKA
jgi:transcriptional regulator with XRE-family HTH domain